ncbi:MAG: radical SAM protein, partial [Clostridia bacterium]|nr:radical SAM protein [Clostridia bacterium]
MGKCFLCPRKCGVDRASERGFCGESEDIRVTRAAPHYWEEPCLSGTNGSGTVFFAGCSLKCVFCQNSSISRGSYGRTVTPEKLCDIMIRLASKGVHNINLVTPTHFSLKIKESMIMARDRGLDIPFVWNSSGYELVSTLKELDGSVDIYLPDLKYAGSYLSLRYSDAGDYFDA